SYSDVEDSIIMEGAQIGLHFQIRRAIIEKNVIITAHTTIGYDLEEDRKHYHVSNDGVVIVEAKENSQQSHRHGVV
ncbi:MAG: glucose-1-phosphate adenylyltransferase, partial [Candidatus Hydrogenedentes bacterium]|nr:glucose-1-phosphate adenylyltransferase [Candidatus Hydrogenedentota bacterium]